MRKLLRIVEQLDAKAAEVKNPLRIVLPVQATELKSAKQAAQDLAKGFRDLVKTKNVREQYLEEQIKANPVVEDITNDK